MQRSPTTATDRDSLLAEVPRAETLAVGRLCLVGGAERADLAGMSRHVAPLVLDAGFTSLDGTAAAIADEVVLVATPRIAPALAAVAVDCLGRLGKRPIVVLNRVPARERAPTAERPGMEARPGVEEPAGWTRHPRTRSPMPALVAQLALGGRQARGELGGAVAQLADRCAGRTGPVGPRASGSW